MIADDTRVKEETKYQKVMAPVTPKKDKKGQKLNNDISDFKKL